MDGLNENHCKFKSVTGFTQNHGVVAKHRNYFYFKWAKRQRGIHEKLLRTVNMSHFIFPSFKSYIKVYFWDYVKFQGSELLLQLWCLYPYCHVDLMSQIFKEVSKVQFLKVLNNHSNRKHTHTHTHAHTHTSVLLE